jgi:hypothetical protein
VVIVEHTLRLGDALRNVELVDLFGTYLKWNMGWVIEVMLRNRFALGYMNGDIF